MEQAKDLTKVPGVDKDKPKDTPPPKPKWFDLDQNKGLKNAFAGIIFLMMIINGTITISNIWNGTPWGITDTWNYWQILTGGAVIFLVGMYYKKDQVQNASKLSKVYIALAILFLLINLFVPAATLQSMGKATKEYIADSSSGAPHTEKLARARKTNHGSPWQTVNVTKSGIEIKVFNNSTFEYISAEDLWVIEESGKKFHHNPSSYPGEKRNFKFYNIKKGGEIVKIVGEKKFPLQFRII